MNAIPINKLKNNKMLQAASRLAACALVVFALGRPTTSQAAGLIKEVVNFDVSGGDVEGLDVTKDGSILASTAPLEFEVEIDDEEITFFDSSITRYWHQPGNPVELFENVTFDLGGGELTDIAIGPHGSFMISNVRDDDLFDGNQLLVIRGGAIVKRIDLDDSADGLALSPDGTRLVLAGEKSDTIEIFDTSGNAKNVHLIKTITEAELESYFDAEGIDPDRLDSGVEPEAVTFTSDGKAAFVSLQDPCAVAVIDMTTLELVNVVMLPYGYLVDVSDDDEPAEFEKFGVNPDGLGVTPDDQFLITANETDSDSQHLGGISVIDLRHGLTNIPEPKTYCVWDLDPTLLDGSGVAACPVIPIGVEPTEEETAAIRALPRIDPNATKTVWRQGKSVTALNIERKTDAQDRGSVLFLDTTDLANGNITKLDRVLVGINGNARPEGLRTSNDGRFFWIGLQNDDGTIARIELNE